ncbi:MAG: heavy metal-binding domain-containing protein [Propionicimonas sp.]
MMSTEPAHGLRMALATTLPIERVLDLAAEATSEAGGPTTAVFVTDRSANRIGLSIRQSVGSADLMVFHVAAMTRDDVTRVVGSIDSTLAEQGGDPSTMATSLRAQPTAPPPEVVATYERYLTSFALGVHRSDPESEVHLDDPAARAATVERTSASADAAAIRPPELAADRVVTTQVHPGVPYPMALGMVASRIVVAGDFLSDFGSEASSLSGERLGGIEEAIDSGLAQANLELRIKAKALGAEAVVGVDVSVQTVADKGELILMIGTAVVRDPHAHH